MVHIIPKKDKIVINPITNKKLTKKGTFVNLNSYWKNRLLDNDIEIVKNKKEI
jgi:hypothetical protein